MLQKVLEHRRASLPLRPAGGPGQFPAVPVGAEVQTGLHQTLPQESSQHPAQALGVVSMQLGARARQR